MGFYTRFKDPAARKEIVRYYSFLEKHDDVYRGNRPHAERCLLFPRSRVHEGDVAAVEAFRKTRQGAARPARPVRRAARRPLTPSGPATGRSGLDESAAASGLSRFKAPTTVRVSASRPKGRDEVTLHFVNYNREEPKEKRSAGRGIKDEKPIAVEGVGVDLVLPIGFKAKGVRVASPEAPDLVEVKHSADVHRVRFDVPRFLVYSIARVELAKE